MKDCRGETLNEGDIVYIYFGYNTLCRGVVHKISGSAAKVMVEAYPNHPDRDSRYSLSRWKSGECMIKWEDK